MSINLVLLGLATTTSPLFVLAAVLMLSSSGRVRTAWAAIVGWIISIGVSAAAVMVIGGIAASGSPHSAPWWMGALDMLLGAVLGFFAVRERRRSRRSTEHNLPNWYSRVGTMSVVAALGVGLFMPANVLAYAAGNEIAQQHLSGDGRWIALAGYIVVGSLIEIGPVLWFTIRPSAREEILPKWNAWLVGHWQAVLAVLFAILSVFLLVKGGVALVRSR